MTSAGLCSTSTYRTRHCGSAGRRRRLATASRRGEAGWSIGQIAGHIGTARLYFASAYRDEGWIGSAPSLDPDDRRTWLPWLETSAARLVLLLENTPVEWLTRRIEMIDTPGSSLAGWRILMMMIEHEIHHRSPMDAYAGLQGWPVPDIFNGSAEQIAARQAEQRARPATLEKG